MEFEIQFFSVAERPLTFFSYFLNAKKVGRRRLVIVPATAGPPFFPTRGFRSLPPALAPVRSHFACGETARAVIGPTFWVCRAKSGAAFRCAKPPCAVVRFAAMTSSPRTNVLSCPPFPRFRFAQAWPLGQQPGACRRSAPFRCAKPRVRSLAPPGATRITAFRSNPIGFRFASSPGPALAPRRLSPFGSISLCETALAGRCPAGATCSLPHFRFARMWPRVHIPAGSAWAKRRWSSPPGLAPLRAQPHPGARRLTPPFRLRRNRACGHRPTFGFAAQNQARHFAARNHPVRLSASRP